MKLLNTCKKNGHVAIRVPASGLRWGGEGERGGRGEQCLAVSNISDEHKILKQTNAIDGRKELGVVGAGRSGERELAT